MRWVASGERFARSAFSRPYASNSFSGRYDRQNSAVGRRLEELVGVPRRPERSRLSFSITEHGRDNKIEIIEDCAERVTE